MTYTVLDNAADLYELVKRLRQQYREAGMPIVLPRRQHTPGLHAGLVRVSALGGCNLQSAFEKEQVTPPLPEMTPDEDIYSAHVIDRGSYTQAMFQEPFVWYAQNNLDFSATAEPLIHSSELGISGYADLLIEYRQRHLLSRRALIEIKDSEGKDGTLGTPKKQYALQLLGYSLATGITHLFILINSKRGYNTYHLRPVNDTNPDAGFMLYDRFGDVFTPDFGEQWNNQQTLNYETVKAEIASILGYMAKVRYWWTRHELEDSLGLTPLAFDDGGIEVPITDPLNERASGWRCVSVLAKPKEYKTKDDVPGIARANCPFAAYCHKLTADKFEFGAKDADGRFIMPHEINVF